MSDQSHQNKNHQVKSKQEKQATERLICSVFAHLLDIDRLARITTKRMRELLPVTQLRKLEQASLSQLEISAESGYVRSWIKSMLNEDISKGSVHPLDLFVSRWDSDPHFPDTLSINGNYPSFAHLVDVYGRDFTAPSLRKMLEEQGTITVSENQVTLERGRKVTAMNGPDKVMGAQCSLDALFSTAIHNLRGQQPPRMERRVWGNRVPQIKARELGERLGQLSVQFRKEALELISSYEVPGDKPDDSLVIVGIGLYQYEQKNGDDSDESGM